MTVLNLCKIISVCYFLQLADYSSYGIDVIDDKTKGKLNIISEVLFEEDFLICRVKSINLKSSKSKKLFGDIHGENRVEPFLKRKKHVLY